MTRRFLILHGWQNRRPQTHWQWQLVESLRSQGEQALYPQLPDPDRPSLTTWTELVQAELAQLGDQERVVIAHSLAVPLWQQVASTLAPDQRVDRVLLVSPPSADVLSTYEEVRSFARIPYRDDLLVAAARDTRLVGSDDDPYCPKGVSATYGHLQLEMDVIPGGGHLDPDAGYGEWPSVLTWCLDPTTRLTGR